MQIEKVYEDIYVVRFKWSYDLSMHFWRYQEYWECPNDRFRLNPFSLIDHMEWYSKRKDNCFAYPRDWVGFNLPGRVLKEVHDKGIPDPNKYDEFMIRLYELLHIANRKREFYVIGLSDEFKDECADHELAHALFGAHLPYAAAMGYQLGNIPEDIIESLKWDFMQMGYHPEILEDETQAWFATGVHLRLAKVKYKPFLPKFRRVFRKFKRELKIQI